MSFQYAVGDIAFLRHRSDSAFWSVIIKEINISVSTAVVELDGIIVAPQQFQHLDPFTQLLPRTRKYEVSIKDLLPLNKKK